MEDQVRNAPRGRGFRRNIEQDWSYLRRLIITVVVVALAYFVWRISDILLLVFAAVLLATLLRSLADLISQHTPIPTRWSLTAATLMIASLVIGFLILFGSQISGQVAQVSDNLPVAVDALGRKIGVSGITAQIEQAIATGAGPSILSRAAGWGYTIIGALADLALVIVAESTWQRIRGSTAEGRRSYSRRASTNAFSMPWTHGGAIGSGFRDSSSQWRSSEWSRGSPTGG